jgi:cell surface protein SprA
MRIFIVCSLTLLFALGVSANNPLFYFDNEYGFNPDTIPKLQYPIADRPSDRYSFTPSAFDLKLPSNIKDSVAYDSKTNRYYIFEKIGNSWFRQPNYLTFEEYTRYIYKKQEEAYFISRNKTYNILNRSIEKPKLNLKKSFFNRMFGSDSGKPKIEIKPFGNLDLFLGLNRQFVNNPSLPENARRTGGFEFKPDANISLNAKIGNNLNLPISYNTLANLNAQNQLKLDYAGGVDATLRQFQAGNTSFISRGTLIPSIQSVFGAKLAMQFGRLTTTILVGNVQSSRQQTNVQGGTGLNQFELKADDYEDNRHFLVGQYFKNNYNTSLKDLPLIRSQVIIQRMEVWVTNRTGATTDARDIVALTDLGETTPFNWFASGGSSTLPGNTSNSLYQTLTSNPLIRKPAEVLSILTSNSLIPVQDFEKTFARKLNSQEYYFNSQLGTLSLQQQLQADEVLGVAYQYTFNGKLYQVGEFSTDVPPDSSNATQKILFLKLLKATSQRPNLPIWDLMMKNVYAVGASNLQRQDFKFQVYYAQPNYGTNPYLPQDDMGPTFKEQLLLQQLNLDKLNNQNDPQPDGQFDFVEGITVNSNYARIMYPVLEPFGTDIKYVFKTPALANQYAYTELYDSIKVIAQLFPNKNRFSMLGSSKSSGGASSASEIYLNGVNIPQGSVTASIGGVPLRENIDYTIDYTSGVLRIINTSLISSGQQVNIQYENQGTFGLQNRGLQALKLDYVASKNLSFGGSLLRLKEQPFFQKTLIGEDPINNLMWGADISYQKNLPKLNKYLNKLPFYNPSAPSSINAYAEVAGIKPGTPKAVQNQVFIDDFEGTRSSIDLRFPAISWTLASTPSGNGLFPEATLSNNLNYGKNRAKLAWYQIEPNLQDRNSPNNPLRNNVGEISKPETRQILQKEIFPQKSIDIGQAQIQTFDLAFFPKDRGPYNFDDAAANINPITGQFTNPKKRWAGLMRNLDQTDFETNNFEFIEFWLQDPFSQKPNRTEGKLYFNLGNLSEDVLKDSRRFYENGLSTSNIPAAVDETTVWGRVPQNPIQVNNAFPTTITDREQMDVGFDGLSDTAEQRKFTPFLNNLGALMGVNNPNFIKVKNDPSNDNFRYYRDPTFTANDGILERYKNFNGFQGNSKISGASSLVEASTLYPDDEDRNRDNTLNETEEYFEYEVDIKKNMGVGSNYIVDKKVVPVTGLANNTTYNETWYLFRIPIAEYSRKIGNIPDFKSIRFIRMYASDFADTVNLRFARLEIIRNQWRASKYQLNNSGLLNNATGSPIIGAVNVEENEKRSPNPYVLPCDLIRQNLVSNNNVNLLQNEQSLSLKFTKLGDDDNRAVIKTFNYDLRQYTTLEMYTHLEGIVGGVILNSGDVRGVMRLGNDFTNNYYEISYPLKASGFGSDSSCARIWPVENNLRINLKLLTEIKERRPSLSGSYFETINGITYTVFGAPNLGEVKGILLGVENPRGGPNTIAGEVWFNELRLSGLDNEGGIAANARLDIQASDFARLSLAGSYIGKGFGTIEQRVQERSRDTRTTFDANLSMELGKILPKKLNISLPVTATLSKQNIVPEYDPLDKDVKLKQKLRSTNNKDSVRNVSTEQRTVKTLTISNAGFKGGTGKRRIYSPSNFDFSYSYRKEVFTSPLTENDELVKHRGALGYAFNPKEKSFEPFKKIIKSKSKWLGLIKDFNFNPMPSTLSFKAELDRQFGAFRARNTVVNAFKLKETYNKYFTFTRTYNMRWNPMKSITIDFQALDSARIDEPNGRLDKAGKKQVWDNVVKGGRNTNYSQTATASYKLPINKIPLLDWTSLTYNYNTTYRWVAASRVIPELGNTIENSNQQQFTADLLFDQLYNKLRWLRVLNNGAASRKDVADWKQQRKDQLAQLKLAKPGKKVKLPKDKNRPTFVSTGFKAVARILTSLKSINAQYNITSNTRLPGFMDSVKYLGNNFKSMNPGLDFTFGKQPDSNWINRAAAKGYMSKSTDFNYLYYQNFDQTLTVNGILEPFRDFKIDLSLTKTFNKNTNSLFKDVTGTGNNFAHLNPLTGGTFNVSYIAFNTLFGKIKPDQLTETFKTLQSNRQIISQRLGRGNIYSGGVIRADGYADGYNRYAQDVLIPAFVSAYTGKNPNNLELVDQANRSRTSNPFKGIKPMPNWDINYNGLTAIKGVDKIFSSFSFRHSYKANFTMNQFTSALAYQDIAGLYVPSFKDPISGNFVPYFLVPNISINESFSPLIGINFTTTNKISGSFDYKKGRQLSLSLIDFQLLENKNSEISLGIEWQKRGLRIPFIKKLPKWLSGSEGKALDNDIKFRLDFSVRDNFTFNTRLDQANSYTTQGQREININPSIDYIVNQRINIRLFMEQRRIKPYISVPPPTVNTRAGVQIRVALQ